MLVLSFDTGSHLCALYSNCGGSRCLTSRWQRGVSHLGYRRFLKSMTGSAVAIDEEKVLTDVQYDGKYVLRTSTAWTPTEVALAYKSLWIAERFFRDFKGPVNVRPIYHRRESQVRGHVVGCFLGLYLAVALRKGLEALGDDAAGVEWGRLLEDVRGVRAIPLDLAGRSYLVRSELKGTANLAFRAAGMKPPPRVQLRERRPEAPAGGTAV